MVMKNLVLMNIVLCLMTFWNQDCIAQNNSTKARLLKQIAETEAEIERLQNKEKNTDSEQASCLEKGVYKQLKPMTNEEFEAFCKEEMPNLTNQKIEGIYSIISSCKQTPNGLQANFCIATTPDVVKKSSSVNNAKEKELLKIRNTKKMYIDLIESLNKELQNNGIEIVDQSANLAVKHIDIDGPTRDVITESFSELKDNMIVQLKNKYNLDEMNIKNENAQLVDDMANQAERLMSMIPGGEKITSHYLWRIFKSTPELGKIIGHTGAMINIYFQINEFEKN